MPGHTDLYVDLFEEVGIELSREEVEAMLTAANIGEGMGYSADWSATQTNSVEDAIAMYNDARDRIGAFEAFDYLSQEFYEELVFGVANADRDELEEMFGGPTDAYVPGNFVYGAEFEGGQVLMEYEDDKIYIPSSYYCGIKCLAKAFGYELGDFASMRKVNPYAMNARSCYTTFKNLYPNIDENLLPHFYKWVEEKQTFEQTNSKMKSVAQGCIVGVRIQKNEYHAVYLKDSKYFHKNQKDRVDINYIRSRFKFVTKYDLDGDVDKKESTNQFWLRTEDYIPKEIPQDCIVYDIETYTDIVIKELKDFKSEKAYEEHKKKVLLSKPLLPYAVAWQYLQLDKEDFKKATKEEHEKMVTIHAGEDCIDQFILSVVEFMKKIKDRDWKKFPMCIYAHNGGNFDHHYVRRSKIVKFLRIIKKGGKIKCLDLVHEESGCFMRLLDSYNYTTKSLKESCKAFEVPKEYCKQDFDIVDKSIFWYEKNNSLIHENVECDWVNYLRYDIISLSFVIYNYADLMTKMYNLSINNVTGLPGLAWKLMTKSCAFLRDCYVCNSPINEKFVRASIKGGRVMHLQKDFEMNEENQGMISLDGNSLYPSAMELNVYPIGIPKSYNNVTVNDMHDWLKTEKMFIAEIEYVTGNQRNPLHPYKNGKDEKKFMKKDAQGKLHKAGEMLLYPQNNDPANPFVDVCNSVDIIEMLKDGYNVLKVRRAIVWPHTAKIFSPLINKLYELRNKYKAEKSVAEQVVKLLLNNMYGKTLERIAEITNFGDSDLEFDIKFDTKLRNGDITEVVKLPNNQIEYTEKIRERNRKPSYLGSFILAYSRQIMNKFIREIGVENIWYGDTDSFYTTIAALNKSSLKLTNDLGGIKNDYGEGKIITKAIFVDYKRYYLEIEETDKKDPTVKYKYIRSKFNGLCLTRRDDRLTFVTSELTNEEIDVATMTDDEHNLKLKEFYENFRDNPKKLSKMQCIQEKWVRSIQGVRIDKKRFEVQVDPELRGQWIDNKWYPLGYKMELETQHKKYDYPNPKPTKTYSIDNKGIHHNLPFFSNVGTMPKIDEVQKIAKDKFGVNLAREDITSYEAFFLTKDNMIVKNKRGQFYKIDNYGIKSEYKEKLELDRIVFALNISGLKKDDPIFNMCTQEIDYLETHKKLYKVIHQMANRVKIETLKEIEKVEEEVQVKLQPQPEPKKEIQIDYSAVADALADFI